MKDIFLHVRYTCPECDGTEKDASGQRCLCVSEDHPGYVEDWISVKEYNLATIQLAEEEKS